MESDFIILGFNHYALEVKDLAESVHFYKDILKLKEIPRPSFDFKGAWLEIRGNHQLHLIENKQLNLVITGSRQFHVAFEVDDINKIRQYFLSKQIIIAKDVKKRPDGAFQMFVKDPDGYYIEFTQIACIIL